MSTASRIAAPTLLSVDQDQFLKAPTLFTRGPWVILAASVLVTLGVLVAGQTRQVESRKAEYQKALTAASAVSASTAGYMGQLNDRLWQTTQRLTEATGAAGKPSSLSKMLDDLPDQGAVTYAVSHDGSLVAPTSASVDSRALASRALLQASRRSQDMAKQTMLNLENGAAIVHRIDKHPTLAWVVHVMDGDTLVRLAERVVGPWVGHIRVEDGAGRGLFEASNESGGFQVVPEGTLRAAPSANSLAAAMAVPLDFSSTRLLVDHSAREDKGVAVVFGIQEASALAEFKGRFMASWSIIGVALSCWMLLSIFVVGALVKFKRTEAYLRRLATTDILTGLPNRRSFHHLLNAAVQQAHGARQVPLALFFLDIDNFKEVNDTAGHPVGDLMLKHVAQLLKGAVRPNDSVCRLAGDEFTILASGIGSVEEAQSLGERIVARLGGVFEHEGVAFNLQVSMGVALMPEQATSPQELMQFADTALYRAKNAGKSRCLVYEYNMTQQDVNRKQTLQDLERALELDDELFLVYQPKYHLASGGLTSHEALIRWQHPTRGLVFPGEFIALAEEAGLIAKLGNWVIRRAVRQIREWQSAGLGWHRVAVNVSALQLSDRSLVEHIASVLGEFKVPGRYLQVEVTESSLASHQADAGQLLQQLRGMGVTIAVDDFGTGYSCLGMLSDFELDCLKVDRSFVNRILTPGGRGVCRAIVSLGQSLGATVVAEGVETPEQAQALAEMGCNEVQGYLFAKPQPADLAPTLLTTKAFLPVAAEAEADNGRAATVTSLHRAA